MFSNDPARDHARYEHEQERSMLAEMYTCFCGNEVHQLEQHAGPDCDKCGNETCLTFGATYSLQCDSFLCIECAFELEVGDRTVD